MPVGVIDESYVFHTLFIGSFGEPVDVTDATIEVFAFESNGTKAELIAPGTAMSAVPGSVGRFIYVYHIPANYEYSSTLYGTMTATDPQTGVKLIAEEFVEVHRVTDNNTGSLNVFDDGVQVGTSVTSMNFIGADVMAIGDGGDVSVYIPPPSFASHYMTGDGDTGAQMVSESTSRTTTRIAIPSGGEGVPFQAGVSAGTNYSTTRDTSYTFSIPGQVTGLGGDSTFTIEVLGGVGVPLTPLDSYTTPALTQNDVHTSPSGALVLTVSNYAQDVLRYKGRLVAQVNMSLVFAAQIPSLDGGLFHVKLTHTTDSIQDDGGSYVYTMSQVFVDTDPTSPSISGDVSISESAGEIQTKHISGIEYYIQGSEFTVGVIGMNQLVRNTARTSNNLSITGSQFGLPTLSHSPFGTGAAGFSNYTGQEDNDGVDYSKTDWSITSNNYRFFGNAQISARVKDTWSTSDAKTDGFLVLVDTYGTTATDTFEGFDDESRRLLSDFVTSWDSDLILSVGSAMVFNGSLLSPESASIQDFSAYKPNEGGVNPDYAGLTTPVDYYRIFVDTTPISRSSFTLVFSGSFVSNATDDLANEDLQIFVRRINSSMGGQTGPGADPLILHGDLYNNAFFNDAAGPRNIRLATSSGNTVNGTFGGFSCEDGILIHIRINHSAIQIGSVAITFV